MKLATIPADCVRKFKSRLFSQKYVVDRHAWPQDKAKKKAYPCPPQLFSGASFDSCLADHPRQNRGYAKEDAHLSGPVCAKRMVRQNFYLKRDCAHATNQVSRPEPHKQPLLSPVLTEQH